MLPSSCTILKRGETMIEHNRSNKILALQSSTTAAAATSSSSFHHSNRRYSSFAYHLTSSSSSIVSPSPSHSSFRILGNSPGSSTGPSSINPITPIVIPPSSNPYVPGGFSFGSTQAVFLTTVLDVWTAIILWTMVFCAFAFMGASFIAIRVNFASLPLLWIWLPPLMLCAGAGVGFIQGALSAALIAAASISIPYPVGIDIAAGLGIGQAICIIYFHLGRADFIHR